MSESRFPLSAGRLERARTARHDIEFWWRDDDAERPGPALDRLLAQRRHAGVPLGLAIIPAEAGAPLADRLASEDGVVVLQHGWSHADHAPAGGKRAEFGNHRQIDAMLADAAAGRERLAALFPKQFLPVFVPPWNRVGDGLAARLPGIGLLGLSAFRSLEARPHRLDAHLDLIDWRRRRGLSLAEADLLLAAEIDRRGETRQGAPIGVLSHHLQHDEAAWALLSALLDFLAPRAGVRWPCLPALFGLDKDAAAAGSPGSGTAPQPGVASSDARRQKAASA